MTYALLIATTFLWGGTFIAGRLVAGDIPPFSASFLRFAIAAVALLPIIAATEGVPALPTRRQLGPILLLGLSGIFSYNAFFFTGLSHISASRAALIIATTPMCITLVSTLFYREPLSRLQAIGFLLSLTGALLVISNGQPAMIVSGGFGIGEFSLLGCVVSWTIYTFVGKQVLTTMHPLPCVFYAILAGTLLLVVPALTEGLPALLPGIGVVGWAGLAYLGIGGTSLGFSWYYLGIKQIGPRRAGVFINLVPVFALVQSWLLLSETLKPIVLAGGFMVCTGVYLTNRRPRLHRP